MRVAALLSYVLASIVLASDANARLEHMPVGRASHPHLAHRSPQQGHNLRPAEPRWQQKRLLDLKNTDDGLLGILGLKDDNHHSSSSTKTDTKKHQSTKTKHHSSTKTKHASTTTTTITSKPTHHHDQDVPTTSSTKSHHDEGLVGGLLDGLGHLLGGGHDDHSSSSSTTHPHHHHHHSTTSTAHRSAPSSSSGVQDEGLVGGLLDGLGHLLGGGSDDHPSSTSSTTDASPSSTKSSPAAASATNSNSGSTSAGSNNSDDEDDDDYSDDDDDDDNTGIVGGLLDGLGGVVGGLLGGGSDTNNDDNSGSTSANTNSGSTSNGSSGGSDDGSDSSSPTTTTVADPSPTSGNDGGLLGGILGPILTPILGGGGSGDDNGSGSTVTKGSSSQPTSASGSSGNGGASGGDTSGGSSGSSDGDNGSHSGGGGGLLGGLSSILFGGGSGSDHTTAGPTATPSYTHTASNPEPTSGGGDNSDSGDNSGTGNTGAGGGSDGSTLTAPAATTTGPDGSAPGPTATSPATGDSGSSTGSGDGTSGGGAGGSPSPTDSSTPPPAPSVWWWANGQSLDLGSETGSGTGDGTDPSVSGGTTVFGASPTAPAGLLPGLDGGNGITLPGASPTSIPLLPEQIVPSASDVNGIGAGTGSGTGAAGAAGTGAGSPGSDGNGGAGGDSGSAQPAGTTPVSILFNGPLNWNLVASNPGTTAQIFAFFPGVIAEALGIPNYNVTTARLQKYSPGSNAADQTLYVAYVPSQYVQTLSQMIQDPTSKFYTAAPSPVGAQLAAHVDRNFNILAVVQGGNNAAGGASGLTSSGSGSSSLKSALIGVSCALGAVVILFLVWRIVKSKKQGQIKLRERPTTIASFAGLSSADHHGNNALYLQSAAAAAGAAGAGVQRSHSASDRGTLREMWTPNGEEQQRAIHGGQNALTETWEISDAEAAAHGMDLYAAGYGMEPATGMLIDTNFTIDDSTEHQQQPVMTQTSAALPHALNANGIMRELDDNGRYTSIQRATSRAGSYGRQSGIEDVAPAAANANNPFSDASEYVALSSVAPVSPLPAAMTNPNRNSRMTQRSDGSDNSNGVAPVAAAGSTRDNGAKSPSAATNGTRGTVAERSSLMSTLSVAERALHMSNLTESQRIQLEFYEQQGIVSRSSLASHTTAKPVNVLGEAVSTPEEPEQDEEAEASSPFGDEAAVPAAMLNHRASSSGHGAMTVRTRMSGMSAFESAQTHADN